MTIAICREDHVFVLFKERFVAINLMTQGRILLRTLERILRFEVTVKSVVEVLHVCHDVKRKFNCALSLTKDLFDLLIDVFICPVMFHNRIIHLRGTLALEKL